MRRTAGTNPTPHSRGSPSRHSARRSHGRRWLCRHRQSQALGVRATAPQLAAVTVALEAVASVARAVRQICDTSRGRDWAASRWPWAETASTRHSRHRVSKSCTWCSCCRSHSTPLPSCCRRRSTAQVWRSRRQCGSPWRKPLGPRALPVLLPAATAWLPAWPQRSSALSRGRGRWLRRPRAFLLLRLATLLKEAPSLATPTGQPACCRMVHGTVAVPLRPYRDTVILRIGGEGDRWAPSAAGDPDASAAGGRWGLAGSCTGCRLQGRTL